MKTKYIKIVLSLVFVFVLNTMNAQETFPENTTDTVPINDYTIPMLIIGIAIGYCLLKKKPQVKQVINRSL